MRSTLVIGLGKTGWSCVNFLKKQGQTVCVIDTRKNPPYLEKLQECYPDVECYCGDWPDDLLERKFVGMVISPGLAINDPLLQPLLINNEKFIGDIELFARYVKAPVVAITGSNGKSSVTSLLGKVAEQAGVRVAVGGNLGTPILELLNDEVELYILELSSFQLETTSSLKPEVAALLNTSPDHMDRYHDFSSYQQTKARVFLNSKYQLHHINEDWLSFSDTSTLVTFGGLSSGLSLSARKHWGLLQAGLEFWLCNGEERVLATKELTLSGQHHFDNALAVLAMSQLLGFSLSITKKVICEFTGLPHRCELVQEIKHIRWFNDSKATNVGAAAASICSVGQQTKNKVIFLAGGQGKNADFDSLQESVKGFVRTVIVFGEDAERLQLSLSRFAPVIRVESLAAAVSAAAKVAQMKDSVLFAPACASFDMFENFEARGEAFIREVKRQLL
ncbi:UDP-N-acetylmuramoyl-L-alanine--D-glutamate ligase [Piscirickettsia litoralis]|uniref:UDP-N-acetylmuramoylalanine--D-glutamate ligase n=1 Tax=Piscirickettsia litoralis TaxID=1891921 RepID=A0ABX3A5X9_9GAMM|nr:UDP-N-acetylmuramoyl-L-alanine--D-glutamate ligase [Piscirickettsia litoralis]ODN43058.1 UDP-N-acetylmuramoylalanine--D-glutamate ligase [Piscirickettsia litoralis]